jgi:hypothetical protein
MVMEKRDRPQWSMASTMATPALFIVTGRVGSRYEVMSRAPGSNVLLIRPVGIMSRPSDRPRANDAPKPRPKVMASYNEEEHQ